MVLRINHLDLSLALRTPDSGLLRLITDGPTDKSPGPFFGPADVGLRTTSFHMDGPTDKSPGPFFGPADVGPWTFLWHVGLDLVFH